MKPIPPSAKVFVVLASLCALGNVGVGIMRWESYDLLCFGCFVVLSAAASRMRVTLPGLNGNMSVNLPFLFLAALELSLPQALIVAAVSTAVQCLPKNGKSMTAFQVVYNISMIVNAVAVAHLLAHSSLGMAGVPPKSLLMAASALGFFLFDTLSVALVIGLAEHAPILKMWKAIVLLSFPYCVLSAGLASMVATATMFVAWYVPMVVFPVMALIYASYRRYFEHPADVQVMSEPYPSSAAADD